MTMGEKARSKKSKWRWTKLQKQRSEKRFTGDICKEEMGELRGVKERARSSYLADLEAAGNLAWMALRLCAWRQIRKWRPAECGQ